MIPCLHLWLLIFFSFCILKASLGGKEKCPFLDLWVLPKILWHWDPSCNVFPNFFAAILDTQYLHFKMHVDVVLQVKERILGSMVPWPGKNFIHVYLRQNPDLYGEWFRSAWKCQIVSLGKCNLKTNKHIIHESDRQRVTKETQCWKFLCF